MNGRHLRAEQPGDEDAVRRVHRAAFAGEGEARLVDGLRSLAQVSLVCIEGSTLAGHVMFTPVELVGEGRMLAGTGLAPLGVLPEFQRKGIGSALVAAGLEACQARKLPFCVVLGEKAYYRRFGFLPAASFGITCEWPVPEGAFMIQELVHDGLRGWSGLARYAPEFHSVA